MQEFQLVVILCNYFSQGTQPESTRNTIFLSLFGGSISQSRISVLIKLVSTSISALVAPVLCAAGTLIQQNGCGSPTCVELTQHLVNDFVVFSNSSLKTLVNLPALSPRFVCNFISDVTDIYLNESKGLVFPPAALLDLITEWVSQNPALCFASQKQASLPVGCIPMPGLTPLAGLIRWCVLSSLNKIGESYSKLHLAVLQSLVEAKTKSTNINLILNSQHLGIIINSIQTKAELLKMSGQNPEENEEIQVSEERFAQAIQIGLASNCIFGSTVQLLCRLETLPRNPLLEIVIKSNRT